jgi:hypothetical protein
VLLLLQRGTNIILMLKKIARDISSETAGRIIMEKKCPAPENDLSGDSN